jgi:Fe-S oxidoreductase
MLNAAKRYLRRILSELQPQIEAGVPLVVLEPSCASVFRDELHNLFPHDPLANQLWAQTFLLSEFLEQKSAEYTVPGLQRKALVQSHCHHKSVLKFDAEASLLQKLGLQYELLTSGCCGMAGSFGFEPDKYEVSIVIGERSLLPAVRHSATSTIILADGFSCREQIAQATGRHALHLAEVLNMAESGELTGTQESFPEAKSVAQRKVERRRARRRAVAILACAAVASFLFGKWATSN